MPFELVTLRYPRNEVGKRQSVDRARRAFRQLTRSSPTTTISSPESSDRPLPFRAAALAALVFAAATILFTWPAVLRLADGMTDNLDAKLNAWILAWDFHQTFREPLRLFDANIFHPARLSLAFSENLFGAALFGFPLLAAGVTPVEAYNAVFLLGVFLSAWGAWALARSVTGDPIASVAAGLVFAFVPWRIEQVSHMQLQWAGFLALALLFLLRFLDFGRGRDLALFALFYAWNGLCCVHYGVFSGLLLLAVFLWQVAARGWKRSRRRIASCLAAVAAASVVLLPFYLPYKKMSDLYGAKRSIEESASYSARPLDFARAGSQNKLYGPLARRLGEGEALFPGLGAVALAALALASRQRRVAKAALWVGLAGLGILVALGTRTPVYRLLYLVLPPLHAIRAPSRGIVLFHLALGILAAAGLTGLRASSRTKAARRAWTSAAVLAITVEYRAFPLIVFWTDPSPAPVYKWLAQTPQEAAVLEWPFGLEWDFEYVFRSTAHFRPLVNGYSGYFPKAYDRLNALFEQRPIPDSIWPAIAETGASLLIYHPHRLSGAPHFAYARALSRAIDAGRLAPLTLFFHEGSHDFAFRIAGGPQAPASTDPAAEQARHAVERYLAAAEAYLDPPIGYLDSPKQGEIARPGEPGIGWALARSGIERVDLATEAGPIGPAVAGGQHPGVRAAHPDFPGADRAGFSFAIPPLSRGTHVLFLTLVARDGGESVLERFIRVP